MTCDCHSVWAMSDSFLSLAKYAVVLLLPVVFLAHRYYRSPAPAPARLNTSSTEEKPKSIMQPAREDLAPPKDDPFTLAQLVEFSGAQPGKPIYVSIKGTVFDVTRNAQVYGPDGSYSIFAGKDASKGLGMSSLKPEDAVPEYSDLSEADRKVLDDWYSFFLKRYNIVGKVIDHPTVLAAEKEAAQKAEEDKVEANL
ncbi:cytochrome b5 [Mycena pura]|uniref:Cytochrome b5 n=1 Tax=Mycena pura TaxID=153505 RepID=A0AAD7E688_9AGAR|nr:cytochrome b5 [Mycena pura]